MKKIPAIYRMIYISLSGSVILIAARMVYSGNWHYASLIWNLFLAFIPFALSSWLLKLKSDSRRSQYTVLMAWLVFFPNAPYIITDFVHLGPGKAAPFWYDIILLFWASWNGLLLGFISLWKIEQFLSTRLSRKMVSLCIYVFILLGAFGVYAGRYLRWNSWDVIVRPFSIMRDLKHIALNPEDNLRTWAMTVTFALLMTTCYFTAKSLKQLAK